MLFNFAVDMLRQHATNIVPGYGRCTQNNGDNDCDKGFKDSCCYEVCPDSLCGAACMKASGREGKGCSDYREVLGV